MMLKRPDAVSFSKANDIHPFEDATSLSFWSKKNDASLFMVGLHSKKRPSNLVFARMFDYDLLDMLEVGIEAAKSVTEFKGADKPAVGQRPLFHFAGELFETHPLYQQFKSYILDLLHGEEVDKVNLAGLSHVVSCSVGAQIDEAALASAFNAQPEAVKDVTQGSTSASTSAASGLPVIHFRTYTISLLASGSRTPLVNLNECGPSFDFRLRRAQPADADKWKAATKRALKKKLPEGQAANSKKRKDRNVDIDEMGDTVGKIYVGKQDLDKLQSRKMKGLKEKSADRVRHEGDEETVADEMVDVSGGRSKRVRT